MKYNHHFEFLANKAGIRRINMCPKVYSSTYILGNVNGCDITVEDMLKCIQNTIEFIKTNFPVNQDAYQKALDFLNLCKL